MKRVILVVSFGTSYNDSREVTIGAIEKAVSRKFPEYEVRRAFTSQVIINILREREGLAIDNVKTALERAVEDGVHTLIVQPTHLMDGYEYMELRDTLKSYDDRFVRMALGRPLLTDEEDFDRVVKIITEKTCGYDDGETAICFMGHGTGAASNSVYAKLQNKLDQGGYTNYYIGTVEAEPSLEMLVKVLKNHKCYRKVVLEPLMVVAGDHANNDMAGKEDDSWKSVLEREGYTVNCLLEGLGQSGEIRDIYAAHVQKAIDSVDFCSQL